MNIFSVVNQKQVSSFKKAKKPTKTVLTSTQTIPIARKLKEKREQITYENPKQKSTDMERRSKEKVNYFI